MGLSLKNQLVYAVAIMGLLASGFGFEKHKAKEAELLDRVRILELALKELEEKPKARSSNTSYSTGESVRGTSATTILQRLEKLEKKDVELSNARVAAVGQLTRVQDADRAKFNDIAKKLTRPLYFKKVRFNVAINQGTTERQLIAAKDGFAILGEVKGKFEGFGERLWIDTKKVGGVDYWYLFGHSGQPHVSVTALVFKYPRSN